MFLRSGLGVIDNVFLKTRRLFNALERPVATTSSGGNTVWHGYAPYNPAMLEKYVTIFGRSTTSCSSATTGRRRRCGWGSRRSRSSARTSSGLGSGCRVRRRRDGGGSGWWWREALIGLASEAKPICRAPGDGDEFRLAAVDAAAVALSTASLGAGSGGGSARPRLVERQPEAVSRRPKLSLSMNCPNRAVPGPDCDRRMRGETVSVPELHRCRVN